MKAAAQIALGYFAPNSSIPCGARVAGCSGASTLGVLRQCRSAGAEIVYVREFASKVRSERGHDAILDAMRAATFTILQHAQRDLCAMASKPPAERLAVLRAAQRLHALLAPVASILRAHEGQSGAQILRELCHYVAKALPRDKPATRAVCELVAQAARPLLQSVAFVLGMDGGKRQAFDAGGSSQLAYARQMIDESESALRDVFLPADVYTLMSRALRELEEVRAWPESSRSDGAPAELELHFRLETTTAPRGDPESIISLHEYVHEQGQLISYHEALTVRVLEPIYSRYATLISSSATPDIRRGGYPHGEILVSFIRDTFLLGDGELRQLIAHELFGSDAESMQRSVLNCSRWPPSGWALSRSLAHVIPTSVGQLYSDVAFDSVSFMVRPLSLEAFRRCEDRDSVHAFDFLGVSVSLPLETGLDGLDIASLSLSFTLLLRIERVRAGLLMLFTEKAMACDAQSLRTRQILWQYAQAVTQVLRASILRLSSRIHQPEGQLEFAKDRWRRFSCQLLVLLCCLCGEDPSEALVRESGGVIGPWQAFSNVCLAQSTMLQATLDTVHECLRDGRASMQSFSRIQRERRVFLETLRDVSGTITAADTEVVAEALSNLALLLD